jgi:hypothetical protein
MPDSAGSAGVSIPQVSAGDESLDSDMTLPITRHTLIQT